MTVKEWNKEAEYALGFYRGINKILGIYPSECHNIFSKIRMFMVLLLNWFLIYELATDLIIRCGTIDEIIESVIGMFSTLVSIAKIILPRFYWKNMKIIVESAVDDWSKNLDTSSRKIMIKWVKIGRYVFIFEMINLCMLIICTTVSNFPIYALINNMAENHSVERILPWGSGCWLSSDLSNKAFLFFYITVCIQQFIGGLSNIGFDVSLFIIVSHICGQIEILKIDVNYDWRKRNLQESINQKKSHRKFINQHNYVLKMCSLLEDTFHLVVLIHMLLYLGMVTVLLFAALVAWQQRNMSMLIQTATSLVIVYIQLFVYCYAGEKLTNQLENLRDRVYSTQWYNLPTSLMLDINFILRRLNDPFHLTCGKFHRMNMDNFKNIVKVTASYCSVIRLMFSD